MSSFTAASLANSPIMFAVFRLMGIAWTIIERQDQPGQQHGLPSRADDSIFDRCSRAKFCAMHNFSCKGGSD
jgi:hypothetical protein